MVAIDAVVRFLIVVMGVSGCGKSTFGIELADRLSTSGKPCFLDADDFHPPENIDKMKNGIVKILKEITLF